MGYEVMNARGASEPASPMGAVPPVDVVDLSHDDLTHDDLTHDDLTHDGHHDPLRAPWSRRTPDGGEPARRGLAAGLSRLHTSAAAPLLPIMVALVVGALLGGFVTGQRAAAQARAARLSALAVVAQVEASTIGERGGTLQADLTARITNAGPAPVELVTDPAGSLPNRLRPLVVTSIDGHSRLVSGQNSRVRLQVTLACGVRAMPDLALTVRTADRRQHLVPLQSSSGSDGTLTTLCTDAASSTPTVEARLKGTTARPLLVVMNRRNTAVRVSFASVVSHGSRKAAGLVTILTTPTMPLVLGPLQQREVVLDVRATRCVQDLDVLASLFEVSYPSLLVTDPTGRMLQGSSSGPGAQSGVDISLLVDRAVERACR